ncbi:four-carbon acid sugar kinase family protein [Streptomyces sp. NPDC006365]|uniref:four-carbon acid sugar kinase family protein n=1 Tax=Streptomyces sp. NPDC006365 TaxID=3364744 RepID=UPI0036CC7288
MSRTTPASRPSRVLALADDLSGAAETAAALGLPGRILLGPPTAPTPEGEAVVLDLDTRQLTADEAARAVRDVMSYADGDLVLKKADSLLRGNFASETAAYAEGAAGVVIALAVPVAGRTVHDGVVHLHGTALHATDAWRAERGPAPESVRAALGDLPTRVVPLSVVRAPVLVLSGWLRTLIAKGHHPVCDAETDADLDAIAEAVLQLGPDIRLLGAGGLAAAVGRRLAGADGAGLRETPATTRPRPLLVVVGTAELSADAQIAQLLASGAHHIPVPARLLTDHGDPQPLATAPDGITIVSIDGSGPVEPGSARGLVAGLARTVAEAAYDSDLVLTGGETARRVLDALGIRELLPVGQIHHGAVHSRTADGRSVVTRPGSFGGTDSLLRIARALRPVRAAVPTPSLAPQGEPT